MKQKLYFVYVLPLRLLFAEIREYVAFTRSMFK